MYIFFLVLVFVCVSLQLNLLMCRLKITDRGIACKNLGAFISNEIFRFFVCFVDCMKITSICILPKFLYRFCLVELSKYPWNTIHWFIALPNGALNGLFFFSSSRTRCTQSNIFFSVGWTLYEIYAQRLPICPHVFEDNKFWHFRIVSCVQNDTRKALSINLESLSNQTNNTKVTLNRNVY